MADVLFKRLLIQIEDPQTGKQTVHEIKNKAVLGSDADCDIKLNPDFVNKKHSLIEYYVGLGWTFKDLDHSNAEPSTIQDIANGQKGLTHCDRENAIKLIGPGCIILINQAIRIYVMDV